MGNDSVLANARTALGDWVADNKTGLGLGYGGGAIVFGVALGVVAACWRWSTVSRVLLFWAAFILIRPLGATVGDFLDKPHASGGLKMSRYWASVVLCLFIVVSIAVLPRRAERRPAPAAASTP